MRQQEIKNNNPQAKKVMPVGRQGFTLVEALVAVFVFSLVMISVVSIFSKFVIVKKRSGGIQRNMEDAKYAMELMAKTIRTSSVIECLDSTGSVMACGSSVAGIEIYDFSQGMCIIFRFSGGTILKGSASPATAGDKSSCNFTPGAISTYQMVGNTINQMSFGVDQTVPFTKIGKVTISIAICSDPGCSGTGNDRASFQTTVSTREYSEVNSRS